MIDTLRWRFDRHDEQRQPLFPRDRQGTPIDPAAFVKWWFLFMLGCCICMEAGK